MMPDEFLRITYGLERLVWMEPDLDQLDVWETTLQQGTFDGGDEPVWVTVGSAVLYGMDPERNALLGEHPFDVADSHSAEAAYYFEHVFDRDGRYHSDVEAHFEWLAGQALFLHDVQVPEVHRRRGYASLLVADSLLTLAGGGTPVFAHPGPTQLELGQDDDMVRLRLETANTRFLGHLGFVPFRDRLWSLDLSTEAGMSVLRRFRRRRSAAGD